MTLLSVVSVDLSATAATAAAAAAAACFVCSYQTLERKEKVFLTWMLLPIPGKGVSVTLYIYTYTPRPNSEWANKRKCEKLHISRFRRDLAIVSQQKASPYRYSDLFCNELKTL